MAWVDSAVRRTENETGVSEMMGALVLISVIAAAIGIIGVGVLSQPPPQKIPAVSVDITAIGNIVYIRHEGGDPLTKNEFNIILDGIDKTASFSVLNGPASWSTWIPGETLYYILPPGQSVPTSVQIIYNSGIRASLGSYSPKIITVP